MKLIFACLLLQVSGAGPENVFKLRGGKIDGRLLASPASGSEKASLALVKMAPKAEMTLHKHTGAEIAYVLSGSVTLTHPVVAKWITFGEREAVYIPPGAVHGYVARGTVPVQLLLLWAPAGPERRLVGGTDETTTDVRPNEKTEGPLPLQATTAKEYRLGQHVTVQILFDKQVTQDGSAHLARYTVSADGNVPDHRHPESEILYVVSGEATVTVVGESRKAVAGEAILFPAKAKHGLTVTSKEPLKALQFFAPSPEQRFGGAQVIKPAK